MSKKPQNKDAKPAKTAEGIISIITEEVEKKKASLEAQTSSHIAKIEKEAEARTSAVLENISLETDKQKKMLDNRIRAEAELHARRNTARTRETVFEEVLDEVKKKLVAERTSMSPSYNGFVKKAVGDAESFRGGEAHIIKGDKAGTMLSSAGFVVKETLQENVLGGVVFVSKDGNMKLDCTLKHILERDMLDIRCMVFGELFPSEDRGGGQDKNGK